MAEEIQRLIFLDSSVLIEYFRKSQKEKSFFYKLQVNQGYSGFLISGVVQLEIYYGITPQQKPFWDNLFQDLILVPFSTNATQEAIKISAALKLKRRNIGMADLIIASTASSMKLPLATINVQHFADIPGLDIITPDSI